MIRVAMLQADSSHAETYIALLNAPGSPLAARARVVHLWDRDPARAEAKAMHGVRIAGSLEDAITGVDVVMVCGRWGDEHHAVAAEACRAALPLYIDKPLTNSFAEAADLAARARAAGIPAFSCSPLRYAPQTVAFRERSVALGPFRSGYAAGLAEWPEFGPRGRRIHFYGVHAAELLHATFGPGVDAVRVASASSSDLVTVRYRDGRLVALHLLRGGEELYEIGYFGEAGCASASVPADHDCYLGTMQAILRMAETGIAPIPLDYAVEIVALLDAIEQGRRTGDWVNLQVAA